MGAPEESLRKEFLEQIQTLKIKIKKKLKPKIVNGRRINGRILADLCIEYTNAINSDKIPSIENAWTQMCKNQCLSLLSEIEKYYKKLTEERLYPKLPIPISQINKILDDIEKECNQYYQSKMITNDEMAITENVKSFLAKSKENAKVKISNISKVF